MSNLTTSEVEKIMPADAALKINPVAIANRDITEENRKLAPEVIEEMIKYKLGRLGLPKSLGGWYDDPVEVLKTYETLSSAEASVGWITWNNHLACTFGKYLDKDSMNEIFGNPSHFYANSTRPEGKATEVPGGYSVSGRWSLVSGCELADWFVLRCLVISEGSPTELGPGATLKLFFLPKSAIKVIDTWHVGGLRGTGSHDIEINDVFVEKKLVVDFNSQVNNELSYSKLPVGCINAAGCAAMALGIAQSATNELIKMGLERITPGKSLDLRDRPTIQVAVANASTGLSAARKQLHDSVSLLWEATKKNKEITDIQLADVWSASYVAATSAKSILNDIYSVSGTAAIYTKGPIERAHRDIQVVLQHGIIQPHWMNQAGMAYLGATPTGAMFRT